MLTYINFGAHDQGEAIALGIDGIRLDVPADGELSDFVAQFAGADRVRPDFLLHDPTRIAELLDAINAVDIDPSRTSIEVFNENRGVDDEEEYIGGVLDVSEACQAREYLGLVIAGACANLSVDAMRWYRRTVPHFPDTVAIAFHDYPYGLQVTDLAWPPSTAEGHQDAMNRLRAITGDRPLVCSEVGRHMAQEITGHPPVEIRLTEQWIYRWLVERLRFYDKNEVLWTAVYQWSDDPLRPDTSEGLYGIHAAPLAGELTGRRKQQAYALHDWNR